MPEEILRCSTSVNHTYLDVSNPVSRDPRDSSPMPEETLCSTSVNHTYLDVSNPVSRDPRDSSPMPEEILCSTSVNCTYLDVSNPVSRDSSRMPNANAFQNSNHIIVATAECECLSKFKSYHSGY